MFGPIVTQRKTKRTATNRFSAGVLEGGERKLEVKVTEIKLYLIVIMKGFS